MGAPLLPSQQASQSFLHAHVRIARVPELNGIEALETCLLTSLHSFGEVEFGLIPLGVKFQSLGVAQDACMRDNRYA